MVANGLYRAAGAISGVFAGFILLATGMYFYPRLTAAAQDNALVNRLVNEQTEAGILLALPGLLATIVFISWIISLLRSRAFHEAAELLPSFVLSVSAYLGVWFLGPWGSFSWPREQPGGCGNRDVCGQPAPGSGVCDNAVAAIAGSRGSLRGALRLLHGGDALGGTATQPILLDTSYQRIVGSGRFKHHGGISANWATAACRRNHFGRYVGGGR